VVVPHACRTLLDVDECRSKRPADTASDVAISTSKVKSSRRNVQRFDRFDSLRRIRISGKSTSASRNIIRTTNPRSEKKRLQRTQYSWYQKKGENRCSKKCGVHCKRFVGKNKLKQNFMCALQNVCSGQKNTLF